jgi:murein tripeptide amidase MpaA
MYLNVAEIESGILALANQYPLLCERITLPNETAEGRTTSALRIGFERTAKPKSTGVLFTANVHAREWGGADIALNFAADLLEAYTAKQGLKYGNKTFKAADVQTIIQNVNVFVVPCVNPDGLNYSQTTDGYWRKNRNPANSGGLPSRIGVDVNRNQDFLWNFKKHFSPAANPNSLASEDPGNNLYHGPSPASEAETRNIVWLFDQHPLIEWYMDMHSYNGTMLYSWGNDDNQTDVPSMNFLNPVFDGKRGVTDQAYKEYIPAAELATIQAAAEKVVLAINAVRGQSYQAKQSFNLDVGTGLPYPTSGANDDYSYSRRWADPAKTRVYGFTLEFGFSTFQPGWSETEKIILDISAGMIEFCLFAHHEAAKLPKPDITKGIVGQILFGVTGDGGGYILLPSGKVIKVPPRPPWFEDILTSLAVHQLAEEIAHEGGRELQKQALKLIGEIAQKERRQIG